MKCSRCKNTMDLTHAVLGGYLCKICGKFNPKLEPTITCLEKPAKAQIDFKRTIKRVLDMMFRRK